MLTAENLTITLGQRPVLQGVSFAAASGHVTAIVGPNGSGKTTLLRALTGDVKGAGRIVLNDMDIARTRAPQLAAVRAVLSQSNALAFPFTVIEVVRLGLTAGLSAATPEVAHQALARVGLSGFATRPFANLSGGEQSRVHLARVLAQVWTPVGPTGPCWLFLDEPVASLDIGHQVMVMNIARSFADAGGGVVAVMHDLNLTAMYADKVTLLGGGAVVGCGAPVAVLTDELLSRAYRCTVRVNTPPLRGPYVLPQAAVDVL